MHDGFVVCAAVEVVGGLKHVPGHCVGGVVSHGGLSITPLPGGAIVVGRLQLPATGPLIFKVTVFLCNDVDDRRHLHQ